MNKTTKIAALTMGAVALNAAIGTLGLEMVSQPDTFTSLVGTILLSGLGLLDCFLISSLFGDK